MLKLHQLFFKKFIILYLILVLSIGLIIYFWSEDLLSLELAHNLTYEKLQDIIMMLSIGVFVVLMLFFVVLLYLTYKISNQLQNETAKILSFLKDLTKKRKNLYISSEYSYEFVKITKLLTKVANILSKKDKQKAKYTAKLQAVNIQKDDIISAISHEFKNPVAIINGYVQTLLEDENINKAIQQKFLLKIYNNGKRLNTLIDTLRLSIKLDQNEQQLNLQECHLATMIYDIVDNLKINYKNKDIKIDIQDDITIKADEMLLSIAISNLVENALKYSEDIVIITINKDFISVTDKGIGIDKLDIDKITQKFYRVSSNSWDNSLGLGLSIVSNIIKIHNFDLQISSIKNQGSTFAINFKQ